ncbi:MAG: bifunctional phosphoribosylaminoimidazolecarboxamide formyltransferase/IMP cyclohydrolase, partial [Planctomycetes bacterium]|nr:bifunctional phosphoribosylaminoimidazolecarboxamide formyltransferase/IMP cyclohydrolase [Planctomycetota bacterium]
ARALSRHGVEILSTGGTARALREAGVELRDVGDHTGFPEMMDGRVKTLHPKVHGGLLALRDNDAHMAKAEEHGIGMIDAVICNLYPFEATVAKEGVTRAEAIEQIDIGGPSMVRSGAKNHAFVTVITDPADYPCVIDELNANGGATTLETRRKLAVKAYRSTAWYDSAISEWLAGQEGEAATSERKTLRLKRVEELRYGENPHQTAAFYRDPSWQGTSLANATQVSGKALSYNNILDCDGALRCVMEFADPCAVVVKHTTPCGAAQADTIAQAFVRAYEGDPLSAFGGIVALNRPCDADTARELIAGEKFLEAVIAPSFSDDAVKIITEDNTKKWRKSIRLLAVGDLVTPSSAFELRSVSGGWLMQNRDDAMVAESDLKVLTQAKPDQATMDNLQFAWRIVKNIKSNAICICKDGQLLGFGGGQTSRVDATEIAISKAGDKASGAVLASDAFFPFADGLLAAAEAGASVVIQPGGSIRDDEVIKAADEAGLAMVFTGMRHFRH